MLKNEIINWIREYMDQWGGKTKAIIGISGGKDSSIAAALCLEALGNDRVLGVLMPCGVQKDINDSYKVCEFLNLKYILINIGSAYRALSDKVEDGLKALGGFLSPSWLGAYATNTPARLRMTALYGVAACLGDCRVVNTGNYSEAYVGYSTKYGDGAGDFSPLGNLTVREVLEVGRELGLPSWMIDKTPTDGMSGKSDEENLGFSYDELDEYLLNGRGDTETIRKIEALHNMNKHKLENIPKFGTIDMVLRRMRGY